MTSSPHGSGGEERLLQLLALKRHEIPPPGFFDRLPHRILAGIRAGAELTDLPWWERAWATLRHEPFVVGSYLTLGVGMFVFGVSVLLTAVEIRDPQPQSFQGLLPAAAGFAAAHRPVWDSTEGPLYRVPVTGTGDSFVWMEPAHAPFRAGEWEPVGPSQGVPQFIGERR